VGCLDISISGLYNLFTLSTKAADLGVAGKDCRYIKATYGGLKDQCSNPCNRFSEGLILATIAAVPNKGREKTEGSRHMNQYRAQGTLKGSLPGVQTEQDGELEISDARITPADFAKPRGGVVKNIQSSIHEWKALMRDIRACSANVARNDWEVQAGINTYRMVLSGVVFKPFKIDQEIWDTYYRLNQRIPELTKQTKKGPLSLKGKRRLSEYQKAWREVLGEQNKLLETLAKAPKSTEFYNRIHLARIKKNEQDVHDEELSQRNAKAREAIEKAMATLGQDGERSIATLGSSILKLEDARQYWNGRLAEISNLENRSHMDADDVISVFRGLEQVIREAPTMAERVKEVEVMFIRLMTMQEELSTYGKNVIPADQLSYMLVLVQDEIPRLWATGEWEKLLQALKDVSSFVKFYDMSVRSELSMAGRRKPGLTKAFLMGTSNLPLIQAAPLIRSLVTAIDARDRYMRGHSDMVAKVAVQIGKRLNWSGEDLELLEVAALLHDVGKIVIPENVLTKIDPLTPDEWKTIQMHPYHGARIVKSLDSLNRIVPWIYHHQERWDGAGYPDGLSAASIPAAARIIGVTEAFTVMVTDQPKRKALTPGDAVSEVQKMAGTQFDPEVAEAFVDAVDTLGLSLVQPSTPSQPLIM